MMIYDSIIEGLQFLAPEQRGQVLTAVAEYLYYGREPEFEMDPACMALFVAQRPSLDEQRARAEAGRRGGRARASKAQANRKQSPSKPQAKPKQDASKAQANAKQTPSEEEEEEEREKPCANAQGKKSAQRFVPPTPEEVDAYIAEMGYAGFTGQELVDHYEANGWMRGRTRISSWKACVRTWANQRRARAPAAAPDQFAAYEPLPDEG